MTIEEYFGDWCKVVDLKEADRIIKYLLSLKKVICPKVKDIFKAFTLCPLSSLRVVIIGQDPYNNLRNGRPVATGLAFANPSDTPPEAYSKSLDVLMDSVIDFSLPHESIIFDPSLEKWEEQGVLLLNSALSCELGKPGSHSLLWRPFMTSLLTNLSKHTTGIVYVLLGNAAQSLESYINEDFNYIIKEKHPSWYARTNTPMPSDIWRRVCNILRDQNGTDIKWFNSLKQEESEEVFHEWH